MAEITAKMIQELREKTAAGMMDCKKALVETNGDIEAAADWLRQKGIVKAASKAGRVAASGLVTVVKCDNMGCVVELNAETDFVAKNDKFQKLVADVATKALELGGDFDATLSAVKDDIAATISTIGENMNLRRIAKVSGQHIYTYIHNALVPGMGQIGVAVAIDGDSEKIDEIGNKIAMHQPPLNAKRKCSLNLAQPLANQRPLLKKWFRVVFINTMRKLFWKNSHSLWIRPRQSKKLSPNTVANWPVMHITYWAKVSRNAKITWRTKSQKCWHNTAFEKLKKYRLLAVFFFKLQSSEYKVQIINICAGGETLLALWT